MASPKPQYKLKTKWFCYVHDHSIQHESREDEINAFIETLDPEDFVSIHVGGVPDYHYGNMLSIFIIYKQKLK